MPKFILILAIAILTFSLGACGSLEEAEDVETLPETAPTEVEGGAEPNEEVEEEDEDEEDDEDEDDEDEDGEDD